MFERDDYLDLFESAFERADYRVLFVDNSTASSMKGSNSLSSVEQRSSSVILEGMNICNEQVEIDQEVFTDSHDIAIDSDSVMANTKQTAQKASGGQGSPAQFASRGKPGGKAAKHMWAMAEDDNNNSSDGSSDGSGSGSDNEQPDNQVQNAIKAGKQR